jgi:hypothetical protein
LVEPEREPAVPFRDACIPVRLGWSSPVQGDLRDQREVRAEQRLLLEEGVDVLDEQGGKYSGDQPERRSVAAGLELADPAQRQPEACLAVGCSSLGTFGTRFTELVGVPPASTGARRCARWRGCRLAWRRR